LFSILGQEDIEVTCEQIKERLEQVKTEVFEYKGYSTLEEKKYCNLYGKHSKDI